MLHRFTSAQLPAQSKHFARIAFNGVSLFSMRPPARLSFETILEFKANDLSDSDDAGIFGFDIVDSVNNPR